MNTPLITEDRDVAREKLRHYRRELHRKADAEFQAIAQGYAELAAGRKLLNLRDAFIECPLDEKGRPRLAIARADRKAVSLSISGNRATFDARKNSAPSSTLAIRVEIPPADRRGWTCYALVPIIPPDARASIPFGTAIATCFVLWEVEKWSEAPIAALPPRDPYLLRHLGGDLYAVLAEWDLTELERAVMAGRARG